MSVDREWKKWDQHGEDRIPLNKPPRDGKLYEVKLRSGSELRARFDEPDVVVSEHQDIPLGQEKWVDDATKKPVPAEDPVTHCRAIDWNAEDA